jgi:hypothetical protein
VVYRNEDYRPLLLHIGTESAEIASVELYMHTNTSGSMPHRDVPKRSSAVRRPEAE